MGIFANNQPGDIICSDRSGSNTIEDLSTKEKSDANDDGHVGYNSDENSSRTEDDKSLVFDEDIGDGDREVIDAAEKILPEMPGTMGLPERQLGQL